MQALEDCNYATEMQQNAVLWPAVLLKKRAWQTGFPVNFAKCLTSVLQSTSG